MAKPIEESWHLIEAWLEANAPRIRANLNPGASDAALDEAETALGITMPADWRTLYRVHDGMNDTGNFGSLFYGMQFMPLKRVLEEQSLSSTATSAKVPVKSADRGINSLDLNNPKWIGLTHDYGDTQLRVDMDPGIDGHSGQVIFTDQAYRVAILLAPNIADFLATFTAELEKGLYTLNPEALADGNHFLDCAKEIDIVNWSSSPRWKHLST
jgi:cell wall assembly regulator SMI1